MSPTTSMLDRFRRDLDDLKERMSKLPAVDLEDSGASYRYKQELKTLAMQHKSARADLVRLTSTLPSDSRFRTFRDRVKRGAHQMRRRLERVEQQMAAHTI